MNKKVAIIGGGAAGFFCAVNLKEMDPSLDVLLVEQGKEYLSKVRISGGGRCNVTNGCEDVKELVKNYPRGEKELLGPFHKFATNDTRWWFEARGVALKEEEDGRVFPVSDDSADIVNCLLRLAKKGGVGLHTHKKLSNIKPTRQGFKLSFGEEEIFTDYVVLATGSSKYVNNMMEQLGIEIIEPVPSLFTFNCKDTRLRNLAGVSSEHVKVTVPQSDLEQYGPLLITHQGFSGPAILKTSAYGARVLAERDYKFDILIDWLPELEGDEIIGQLRAEGKRKLLGKYDFLPNRLWEQLLMNVSANPNITNAELNKQQILAVIEALKSCRFSINGKSTFKEEFVTSGGISLKEIDFRSFGIKKFPGMYAAGEILDIDGVTGGFNFQNAWTGAYLIASAIAEKV